VAEGGGGESDELRDSTLVDELEEFVELLEEARASRRQRKVLAHVRATRAIVSVQLPDDADEDAHTVMGMFIGFFVEHSGAMIQADAEGFYEGNRLLVPLE
jgi:hypothetical protein